MVADLVAVGAAWDVGAACGAVAVLSFAGEDEAGSFAGGSSCFFACSTLFLRDCSLFLTAFFTSWLKFFSSS